MQSPDDLQNLDPAISIRSPIATDGVAFLDRFGITDVMSSGTIQLFRSDRGLFSEVLRAAQGSLPSTRERMLDMGCGYGALSSLWGYSLGFKEIFGLDRDDKRMSIASRRGLKISHCDLGEDKFPFDDNYFDFATSFGVLDHIKILDNPISEAHRVLKLGGCLAMSTTNLSSWVNRLALLLGYQPRNLEISEKGLFGVHKLYKQLYTCTDAMGRISSFTLRALEEFLNFNGFYILKRWGAGMIPSPDRDPGTLMKMIDRILSKRPSLAVRYILLAKKIR